MAFGSSEVNVRGLKELNAALRQADRETRLGVRKSLREVAEPVRAEAEQLAGSKIKNNRPGTSYVKKNEDDAYESAVHGPDWRKMRTGITKDSVYVAPRQRGKKRGPQKRPNLAPLLMDRAMQPALDHHTDSIVDRFDRMLGEVEDRFGR